MHSVATIRCFGGIHRSRFTKLPPKLGWTNRSRERRFTSRQRLDTPKRIRSSEIHMRYRNTSAVKSCWLQRLAADLHWASYQPIYDGQDRPGALRIQPAIRSARLWLDLIEATVGSVYTVSALIFAEHLPCRSSEFVGCSTRFCF